MDGNVLATVGGMMADQLKFSFLLVMPDKGGSCC